MSKPDVQPDDDRVSLHPLGFEEALDGLLNVEPDGSTIEERTADFMDAVVERDARSKAGVERTDGFLTHEELLARIRRGKSD